ncbi:hypothetical protein AM228_06445 [Planktothricoides sp. SR001]|uniref:DUF4058 family protein n=1 Tax=Planktothricoides sp. SR001 TaxID=1705388 RepID=UPI0006C48143|nr:DUF4058 family protein [Planktothricoides sp. SR001]KOR37519.1 hypothetical protein AM228_06445 [Planktothricoides sp. SR001]
MPNNPFPGINPYLEHPELWPGIHLLLIGQLTQVLAPQLRPKYRVAVEVRIYEDIDERSLVGCVSGSVTHQCGIPDLAVKRVQTTAKQPASNVAVAPSPTKLQKVAVPVPETIKQGYLEIREVATQEVITAIEILSPVNKRPGEGREKYQIKRNKIFSSATHLVEIDLLRRGEPMPVYGNNLESHYRILVSRSDCRPEADLYSFNLPDPIPSFPLPLKAEDSEPRIDLQALLNQIYDTGSYDMAIDYTQAPVPPLLEAEKLWAEDLLKSQQLIIDN